MQLTRLAVVASTVVCMGASAVFAEGTFNSRVTFFHEPSSRNAAVTVVHPQVDAQADVASSLKVQAGYDADIVSGATPVVFGPLTGPDAVSGATQFSDVRHTVRGGFEYTRGLVTLAGSYRHGWENDYKSDAISVGARADMFERNLTLALGYTRSFDLVCNAAHNGVQGPLELLPLTGSQGCFDGTRTDLVSEALDIHTFEPSLTWTVTPRLLLMVGGTVQLLEGFQSNPYRMVLVGSQHRTPQEHHPRERQRYATHLRLVYAFPNIRASAAIGGRLYRDSWGVDAGAGELEFNKYLGTHFLVRVRSRYHQQTGSTFYRTSEGYRSQGPAGQYFTGDRELSPMGNLLLGAKIAFLRSAEGEGPMWGFLDAVEVALKFDYLRYLLDSDFAPNADRSHALIMQTAIGLTF